MKVGPALISSALAILLAASPVNAFAYYSSGYTSANHKDGIRGYVVQTDVEPISIYSHVANWLGLFNFATTNVKTGHVAFQWLQVGTYQGGLGNGESPDYPSRYYEATNACGDYYEADLGPQNGPMFGLVKYTFNGLQYLRCEDGFQYAGYLFEIKKGSATSTPILYSSMSIADGPAVEETEVVEPIPTYPYSYLGCGAASPSHCDDPTYEIEVYHDGGWTYYDGNPDGNFYLPHHDYNLYWSFRTCPKGVSPC